MKILRAVPVYILLLAAGGLVAWSGNVAVALGYAAACRLSYVLYVGAALRLQTRRGIGGPDAESRFERFRRAAAVVMNNDAIALVSLCVATRGTMPLEVPLWSVVAVGAALVAFGFGVKIWAILALGTENYFWRDFFLPPRKRESCIAGPYRFFRNPMYSVGYAQAYGVALALASWPGLAGALFAHVAIWAFFLIVERPHVLRTYRRPALEADALGA